MKTLITLITCLSVSFSSFGQSQFVTLKLSDKIIANGSINYITPVLPIKGFKDYKSLPRGVDSLRLGYFVLDREQYWFDQLKNKDSLYEYYLKQINDNYIDTTLLSKKTLKSYVGVVSGISQNKKFIKFDANNNHDFIDDVEYLFDVNNSNDRTAKINIDNYPIISVYFQRFVNQKVINDKLLFKLKPFDIGYSYFNKIDSVTAVYAAKVSFKTASLVINNENFNISIFERFGFDANLNNSRFLIYKDNTEPKDIKMIMSNEWHRLENRIFRIVKVSNDSITVETNSNSIGFKKDDFIPNDLLVSLQNKFHVSKEYYLVSFWDSSCETCTKQNDLLRKMNYDYRQNISFFSVAVEQDALGISNAKQKALENNITWPQEYEIKGAGNTFNKSLNTFAYPTTLLIDKNGKIIEKGVGILGLNEVNTSILDNGYNKWQWKY